MRGASYARRRQFSSWPDAAADQEGASLTVEQRWHAHSAFRGLLALELRVTCSTGLRLPGACVRACVPSLAVIRLVVDLVRLGSIGCRLLSSIDPPHPFPTSTTQPPA